MQTFSKYKRLLPSSTVHQSRLRLFQATRRPKAMDDVVQTSWGMVRIKGRVGQTHADVMESIFACAEKVAETPDGRIKLLVDPWRVKQKANQLSGSTLRRILDDLMQVLIEIKEPVDLACIGHVIDHVDFAKRADGTPITKENPMGGHRGVWIVEVGKAFCMLMEKDLKLWHDPEPISRLNHGVTQAVARHVLTHKIHPFGGWTLDGLIRAVSGEIDTVAMRHRRNELRSDAKELESIGILLDGNKIKRLKNTESKC